MLDFSSVNNIDVTAVQALIDVRNQLDKYAAPESVEWHFANIENRWTKKALCAGGFGLRASQKHPQGTEGPWKTIFSVADLVGFSPSKPVKESGDLEKTVSAEITRSSDKEESKSPASSTLVAVQGLNRPLFHLDLQEAVEAAVADAQRKPL